MKLTAVIFDLDGTIIDSEKAWGKAFVGVFDQLGVKANNDHPQVGGVSLRNNWLNLIKEYNIKTTKTPDELVTLTYLEYEKQIPFITINDGFFDFMDLLKDGNLPTALATSTKWDITDKILDQFGMSDLFNIVTTGEEVLNPKPAPDIFILTADKLGVDREDCLVIEDSGSGVTAAREAGMRVVAISDEENISAEVEKADKVVESFSDIKFKEIELLF